MKAILVGRHSGEIPNLEIIQQINMTFDLNTEAAFNQFEQLYLLARQSGAALIFQNIPGVLGAALFNYAEFIKTGSTPIGVIISIPTERLAGVSQTFVCEDSYDCAVVESAVRFANGRAKVEYTEEEWLNVVVTVDPISQFIFSHIKWLVHP